MAVELEEEEEEEEEEERKKNLMQSQVKINEIDIREWQRGIENEGDVQVGRIANLSNGLEICSNYFPRWLRWPWGLNKNPMICLDGA